MDEGEPRSLAPERNVGQKGGNDLGGEETKSPEKDHGLDGGQQEDESDPVHEVAQARYEDNQSELIGEEEEREDPKPKPAGVLKETSGPGPGPEVEAVTIPEESPIARRTRGKTGRRGMTVGQQLEAAQVAGDEGMGGENQGGSGRDGGSAGGRRLTRETLKGSGAGGQ